MEQYSARDYLTAIRAAMPLGAMQRVPARLWWLPVHLLIIVAAWAFLSRGDLAWGWMGLVSVVVGHSYACLMFLGHELMHESIVARGPVQRLCAWICFLPYWISPEQWRTWHNHWHHRHTSLSALDPDSWGNVATYQRRAEFRLVEPWSPGSGCFRSVFFLGFWFGLQGLLVLTVFGRLFHYWTDRQRLFLYGQWLFCGVIWLMVLKLLGLQVFIFAYVLPMIGANAVQMSYIATNHLLMPETVDGNDPLRNSLSVTTWKVWNFFHLNFSHHIEHHVAPGMSPRYAPLMRQLLKAEYPEKYKELPHWQALKLLYQTPKLHWDGGHLVNPRSGAIFATIGADSVPVFLGKLPVPVARPTRKTTLASLIVPTNTNGSRQPNAGSHLA